MIVLAVGSKNRAKVYAVQEILIREPIKVVSLDVPSEVAKQPLSDEETLKGAINRAKACLDSKEISLGIGLEGGVCETDYGLMLCNWGALVNRKGNVWVASGAKIPVPHHVAEALRNGEELGDIMARLTDDRDIRVKMGAVGIFTNERITRKKMFAHIVELLYGQYLYHGAEEIKH
nr:DUF84 family protein [Halalkalibacterium ligniniphilum]